MVKIKIEPYGKKGQVVSVTNPSGQIGAQIYIGKDGYVHCDSWLGERH